MKKYLLLVVCLIIISGCGGGGGSDTAPVGSTVTVNPSSFTITSTNAAEVIVPQNLRIVVKNSAGQALGDMKVKVTYVYTTVPSDLTVIKLNNSNDVIVECQTDNFGGCNVPISFKTKTGLNYAGNIEVSSGSNVVPVPFTVTGT